MTRQGRGIRTVAEHHPNCDGYTCDSTCPIPVPLPEYEREPCPHCVDGWNTCPTCNGSGEKMIVHFGNKGTWTEEDWEHKPCPDCVDGMSPSPELVERVAKTVAALMIGETDAYYEDAPHHWNGAIRAGLLASRRGEQ